MPHPTTTNGEAMRTTSAQLRTVDNLKTMHGPVAGHTVLPSGYLEVWFTNGYTYVITRSGEASVSAATVLR